MNKVKIGVIGAGRIGKVHVATLAQFVPNAEVVVIADANIEEAKSLATKFGITQWVDNYKDVITNKDIDAVIICSPTNTHTQYIIEAAENGKDIFCEKPIDLSIDLIKNAINAVEKHNVKLMIGFNRRFDPNFFKIRQMVEEGKIGEPHILRITSRDPAPPPAEYSAVSGGMFLDMTIHDFDMAQYIVNSQVVEVYTKATVLVDPEIGDAGDVDTAIITLTFANGAIGVIDNSRKAVYGYDQRLEIFGSEGMVNVDNNYPENHRYYSEKNISGSLPLNFFMDRYTQSYMNEMLTFCDLLSGKIEKTVSGKAGLNAVAIAIAAKKSYLENRPVKIKEIV